MTLSQLTARYPTGPTRLLHLRVQASGGPERVFQHSLGALAARCAQIDAADDWQLLVRRLRWASILLRNCPLALSSNLLIDQTLPDAVRELAGRTADGELARLGTRAAEALAALLGAPASPLLDAVEEHLRGSDMMPRVGLLAYDRKLVPLIRQAAEEAGLADHTHLQVGDWATLASGPLLDELCLIGSSQHYPPGIYKSGVAKSYTRVAYAWDRPDPTPGPWYGVPAGFGGCIWNTCHLEVEIRGDALQATSSEGRMGDWEPMTSERYTAVGEDEQAGETSAEEPIMFDYRERIPARPVFLGGGRVLHLGAGLREEAYVLRPDGSGVREVPVMDLSPGDRLIVPETADRDYRRSLIDKQLGKHREACRQRQAEWKTGLAKRIAQDGLGHTIEALKKLGCKRANEPNLHNWAYGSVVCPQRGADFLAIMQHLGRSGEYGQQSMKLLRLVLSASHQASETLLRELRRGLASLDLDRLAIQDEHAFQLKVGDGVLRFRLVRVSGIGPVTDIDRGRYGIITQQ